MTAEMQLFILERQSALENGCTSIFRQAMMRGSKKSTDGKKQIARFEYIITDSELEALVLECNLIKEHRPKYNTMLCGMIRPIPISE